jgi:hypothetical protein
MSDKPLLEHFWVALAAGSDPARFAAPDLIVNACAPFDQFTGLGRFTDAVWQPMAAAFTGLTRRPDIAIEGVFRDARWVSTTGHFEGVFAHDWLTIPATGAPAAIRYGEFWRIVGEGSDARLAECVLILDIVDVMHQAGFAVLPGYGGREGRVPGPTTRDGIVTRPADPAETAASLTLVEDMIYKGLLAYDGQTLASMNMAAYWTPDMRWYGPSPIGACASLHEFEVFHQAPFLRAFPDRRGGNHRSRIAEGAYVASTGYPSITATFVGDYLGVPATGETITMRVMDWWRAEPRTADSTAAAPGADPAAGLVLAENWVFIDLIDWCRQIGIDLFARLSLMRG